MSTMQTEALSNDPNRAIQEMMDIIDSLRGVYTRETDALENIDAKTFLALQAEKIEAAKLYQDGVEQILSRSVEMKDVNPLLKKRLEDMQKEFSTLTTKNLLALERMKRTTERLSETIRSAARDTVKKQTAFSYGETGALNTTSERKSISIGMNETA